MTPVVPYSALLGCVLRHYREAAGSTQRELADVLEITASGYSRLETGVVPLTVLDLARLCGALGVSLRRLFSTIEGIEGRLQDRGVQVLLVGTPEKTSVVITGESLRNLIDKLEGVFRD